jgi:hypothetical protein
MSFTHYSSLKKMKIAYKTVPGDIQLDFNYYSSGAIQVITKSSGQAPLSGLSLAQTEAGASIKFSRGNAIVFMLRKCKSSRISDLSSIESEILSKHDSGEWKEDMVVVTEVITAYSATILISQASKAQIDLLARGSVGVTQIDLADVRARFQVLKESNLAIKFIAERHLTPLFKASGLSKSFWTGKRRLGMRPLNERTKRKVRLSAIDYEDYDLSE